MKQLKINKLLEWCTKKGIFSKPQVDSYGVTHEYTSAVRRIQELAEYDDGIRRLTDDEAKIRGFIKKGNKVIAWYEMI